MSMKVVEEISRSTIKPCSPTPNRLKTFHFSLLDQISPPIYTPIIFFYGSPHPEREQYCNSSAVGINNISDRLKKSLSDTLTRFYPVAGRIKDNNNMFLECNDEGTDYIEARAVDSSISNFMKRDSLHHLLPANIDLHAKSIMDNGPQLIVKVTFFDCGGIAICICISHKIADASTFTTFINSWASIARGGHVDEDVNYYPTFESSILYPPREGIPATIPSIMSSTRATDHEDNSEPKICTKRLVFDAPQIAALRAKYQDPTMENCPTRVEAVSSLVWKIAMAASSSKKPCIALYALNMRKRMHPSLPPQTFGNMITVATIASPTNKESITEGRDLVRTMKEAMSKMDSEHMKAMQGDEGLLKVQEMGSFMRNAYENMEIYTITSWCRFPLYESDFGWGKPIWVTTGGFKPFKNMVHLMDSNGDGDGIQVIVGLLEEEMAIFELDQELLEFVSIID